MIWRTSWVCVAIRRFVKDFYWLTGPLCHLAEKNIGFHWSPDCQEAFVALKLTKETILAYPKDGGQYEGSILSGTK